MSATTVWGRCSEGKREERVWRPVRRAVTIWDGVVSEPPGVVQAERARGLAKRSKTERRLTSIGGSFLAGQVDAKEGASGGQGAKPNGGAVRPTVGLACKKRGGACKDGSKAGPG